MQTVSTPDGQVYQFPDTMSREQMAAAIQARLAKRQTGSASGDLRAGMLQAQMVIPSLRANKHLDIIQNAQTGNLSQGNFAQNAQYLLDLAKSYEADLNLLEDPDERATLADQIADLRNQAANIQSTAATPTAQNKQASLDAAAGRSAQTLATDVLPNLMDLQRRTSQIPMSAKAQEMFNPEGDTFLQQTGDVFDTFREAPGEITRTVFLRSLPAMIPTVAAAIAGTAVGGPAAGGTLAGLVGGSTELGIALSQELTQELGSRGVNVEDPNAVKAWSEANPELITDMLMNARKRALAIGTVDAATGLVTGRIARAANQGGKLRKGAGVITGATVGTAGEGLGESAALQAEGKEQNPGEIAGGMLGAGPMHGLTTAGQMVVQKSRSLYTSDGTLADPTTLEESYRGAAGDVARQLQELAKANGYNLKDIDNSSEGGAKQALEDLRQGNNETITDLVAVLKPLLSPKNAKSLEDLLLNYTQASAGIKGAKKKVSSRVTQDQLDAARRLVGGLKEGQELLNALQKSNVITDLFKRGVQGGVSRFTDLFNPISMAGAGYNAPKIAANAMLGSGLPMITQGGTIPAQGALWVMGRLTDAMTGRRSKVARFVRQNTGKFGLPTPEGPSIIAAEQLKEQKAEASKNQAKEIRASLAQFNTKMNVADFEQSPIGNFLFRTGLDKQGLIDVVSMMAKDPDIANDPGMLALIDQINENLAGGENQIEALSDAILAVGAYAQENAPELIKFQPDSPSLLRSFDPSASPEVSSGAPQQPTQDPQQSGRQFTSPENYQAGEDANIEVVNTLQSTLSTDLDVSVTDKGQLLSVLGRAKERSPDIVAQLQTDIEALQRNEVSSEAIDKYVRPYLDRVTNQREQKSRLQRLQDAPKKPNIENTEAPAPTEAMTEAPALAPDKYSQALNLVAEDGKVSASWLQRKLGMPYSEAQTLVNRMEAEGYISAPNHVGKREVLVRPPRQQDDRDLPSVFTSPKVEYVSTQMLADTVPQFNYPRYDTGKFGGDFESGNLDENPAVLRDFEQSEKPTLKESIAQEGIKEPIEIEVLISNGEVSIGQGHHRLQAAIELGLEEVPVVILTKQNPRTGRSGDGVVGPAIADLSGLPKDSKEYSFSEFNLLDRIIKPKETAQEIQKRGGTVFMDPETGRIADRKFPAYYTPIREKAPALRQQDDRDLEVDQSSPARPALSTPNPLQIPETDLQATNLPIMPSPEEIVSMREGSYKPDQKRTLVEAADFLNNRWQASTGQTEPFEYTPENVGRISSMMATEAMEALKNDSNAIGWYDRKIKAAKAVTALVEPRIMQSPDAEAAFDFALAVTSNGQAVADNFAYTVEVFRDFMDNGKMPTDTWNKGGERNGAMVEAFNFFNAYNASGRNMPIQDFLSTDFTVAELDNLIKQFNAETGSTVSVPSSESRQASVKGSYIMGPKIGQGFYQNIRGNYDPLTMDIWWMRMWNRMVGRPFEASKDVDKNRARIREAVKTKNQTDLEKRLTKAALKDLAITRAALTDDEVLDQFVANVESKYQSYYRKKSAELKGTGNKVPKPELFKASGTMVKNMKPQLQAQPKGPGERQYMREVTQAALAKLKSQGYPISTADFQALMWYPEKQLFRKLGVAPGRGADNDYLDAAKLLAAKEGIPNEQIEQTLGASGPDGAVASGASPTEAQSAVRGDADRSGREETTADDREAPALSDFIRNGSSQLRRALSRRVPSKQEVVGQFPAVKALFEIGKKGSPYENGITNIEDALTLAKALGITVHMFNDHQKMLGTLGADSKTLRGRFVKTSNGASGHVFALEPGTDYRGRNLTDIEALTTLLHEIFHGVTMGPMSGVGPMLNGNGNGTPSVENAVGAMIDKPQGKRTPQERKILREITRLQNSLSAYVEGKPTERRPVRGLIAAMDNFDQQRNQMTPEEQMDFENKIDAHVKYIRSKGEFSVDPFWVYAVNPKMAKLVMPETAKWIRGELRKAGNKDIQFFTHPLAISIAVVMALMASEQAEDEQEEQQRQQMQPGALSPTAGMLSAA